MISKRQNRQKLLPREKMAIFLRDGLACCWCSESFTVEQLTIDHVETYDDGGNDKPSNLVTSCRKCNLLRGSNSMFSFAEVVGGYARIRPGLIRFHIKDVMSRDIDVYLEMADRIIDNRLKKNYNHYDPYDPKEKTTRQNAS